MNILYINHYAGSIEYGMAFRPYYLAKEWIKSGHNVWIMASDFSHLRTKNPTIEKDMQITYSDGVEYQWLKAGSYTHNGVKCALSMFRFVRKIKKYSNRIVKEFNPDVVISSSTYPLDTYGAQKIVKLSGAKLIHEGHDLWPLTLIEIGGMSKNNPFVKILGKAERSAYIKSDKVVLLFPSTWMYCEERGSSHWRKLFFWTEC